MDDEGKTAGDKATEDRSVRKMWESYLESKGENSENFAGTYTSWYFCDDEKSADELARLVKTGTKRATTSLFYWYDVKKERLPAVGDYSIITDWKGLAQCIIQTKRVDILPFNKVDAGFAFREGEGDKSLNYWREAHVKFFTKELGPEGIPFSEDMLVVCEEFEVEHAAKEGNGKES